MRPAKHPVAWVTPQPWWRPGSGTSNPPDARDALAQPQILRFANDEFIEELLAALERDPGALPNYTAQAETWREPHAGPKPAPERWLERPPARALPLLRRAAARAGKPVIERPKPLKLYQPAHQRHYLVAGSLVCQAPGLPDRAVDAARQRVGFVLRRLWPDPLPPIGTPLPAPSALSGWKEYAWVLVGKSGEWREVGHAASEAAVAKLLEGEERLSMFPAAYAETSGHPRKLFVGSVPVGRRETYQGAQAKQDAASVDPNFIEPRIVQLHTEVLGPWRTLVNKARDLHAHRPSIIFKPTDPSKVDSPLGSQESDIDVARLFQLRSELQMASWYTVLDLRRYLETHVPEYTDWLDANPNGAPPATLAYRALHDALARVATPTEMRTDASKPISLTYSATGYQSADIAVDLPDALRRIVLGDTPDRLGKALTGIDGAATQPFALVAPADGKDHRSGWPGFLFLLLDPWSEIGRPVPGAQPPGGAGDYAAEAWQAEIDALDEIVAAIAPRPGITLPEPALASMRPADMREAWYVMRLVYERPECRPFEESVVSRATVPFQMAGFFDPDAPARPIRIGLPIDISPAGLRKFDKNAVFMMSDMLCGHLDRFKGITLGDIVLSVLPWPFHKDLSVPDKGPCKEGSTPLGVMCTLSIPIITICALILLMIIVSLLELIFHWLPLFIVCFPLPGFKGKKDG